MPDDGIASPFVVTAVGFFPIGPAGPLMSAIEHWKLCDKVETADLIDAAHPGDPLPFDGHRLVGVPDSTNVDAGAGEPVTPVPLTIAAGDVVNMTGCGPRLFTSLEIYGTLKPGVCNNVVYAGDVHIHNGGRIEGNSNLTIFADSLAVDDGGEVHMNKGNLEISVFGQLNVSGKVTADGSSEVAAHGPNDTPWVGSGGGGHFGAGGPDGFGNDGVPALPGDYAANSKHTEEGTAGAGPDSAFRGPGKGGGAVTLSGHDLTVSGTVSANGADATSDLIGDPYGGGAGGGILLMGDHVHAVGAVLHANGGKGGCGIAPGSNSFDYEGGGGGGAGIIKFVAGLLDAQPQPNPHGGDGSDCSELDRDTNSPGGRGADGTVTYLYPGKSQLEAFPQYWQRNNASGHIVAYVDAQAPTDTFNVYVCARKKDQPDGEDPEPVDDPNAMNGITPGDDTHPCGFGFLKAGSLAVSGRSEISHELVPLTLGEGEWVLWTTVGSSDIAGQTCPPTGAGPSHCTYEPVPSFADDLIGVDDTAPVITDPIVIGGARAGKIDDYTYFTGSRDITVATGAVDQTDKSNLSYLGCAEFTATQFLLSSCTNDGQAHALHLQTDGDGAKTIRVFAVDRAGNVGSLDTTVIYDTTPAGSQSTINISPDPNGANGWYKTPPNFSLVGSFDGPNSDGSQGSGAFNPAWAYRVDGNAEKPCPDRNVCSVLGEIPGRGVHVVHYTPIDGAQNRLFDDKDPATPSPMFASIPIKVDPITPDSELLTSPAAPDGTNGWFVTAPWVVLLGTDRLDGSGLSGGGAGITYSINGGTPATYTAPFKLGEGTTTVCWSALDVAGNAEGVECRTFNVDTHDPTVTVDPNPGSPDTNGWYTSSPTFTVSPADATAGVDPTSLVVSVDGGPLFTPGGAQSIPEGRHDVRARVRDNAGRYSAVDLRAFEVDLSTPVVSHRVLPPDPAQNNWYRRLPRVALVANDGDENAGVDHIEYRIGAGPYVRYSAPFELGEGRSSVTYRAFDRAGHVSAENTFGVATDVTSPVAKALTTSPAIWVRHLAILGLGPKTVQLNYSVMDPRLPGLVSENERRNLHVIVIVHDALGNAVRRIDAGNVSVAPGTTDNGSVTWDGSDQSLTKFLGIGTYYYRVIATDEAGNWTETGESQPLQIVL
jgi:hypothetical protein